MAKIMIPLFLINLLLFLPHQTLSQTNSLIPSACQTTPNPQLCITTIQKDPRSSTAGDMKSLAIIIVDALKANAQEGFNRVNELLSSNDTRPVEGAVFEAVAFCGEYYNIVVKELKTGDPKASENGVADAAVQGRKCEEEFTRMKFKPLLSDVNKALVELSGVAEAIIKLLS